MKKGLIALALAGMFVAPAAMADTSNVNIYGTIDVGYASMSNGTSAAGVAGTNTNQISSQTTKLGLKGSEDLGDGLSAIWQIEQQIDIDNAGNTGSTNNTLAGRNSFLGLKSDSMGTVLMGRHDTPYKIATRKLDLFADSFGDNRALMGGGTTAGGGVGGAAHDARLTNVLAYISPSMSGFTVAAAYAAGGETATVATNSVKGAAWSLAGMYDAGPLYLSLGYQAIDYGGTGTGTLAGTANNKYTATKLGAQYQIDALTINGAFEKTKYTYASGAADDIGRTDWTIGAKYTFGNDAVKIAYTHAGNVANVTNKAASMVALGYDHILSKRTTVYAQYATINNDSGSSYILANTSTAGASMVSPGAGAKPSIFGLGIKHSF